MNRELHHVWQRFRDDDDAFVLVITGAGDSTFCAGWDLAKALRSSEIDWNRDDIQVHVRKCVEEKLRVGNPRWLR
jgi:enoyl-CoA hydratase/carnithine racemase